MKKILITLMITAFCFGQLDLKQDVPFNSDIVYGKLPNGLTYYILKNDKPADRAELRLAVNIGSVDEEDHEQGIAHFLEHMCFNGTEKYPRNTLVDYLESLGMAFGPDLNAYTSFDRTVYMLQIPTNDHDKFISGIEIMSEWAGYVSLEGEEIDKERGVVKEEWRMRRGASARISDEQFPVLFEGSKYANRLPIGKMDVIDKMTHDDVRGYYNRWYRPDLMAFIAVGDFDVVETENMIKAQFGRIPAPENPVIPQVYDVPEHEESRVVISTDPEAQRSSITITYKMDVIDQKTVSGYREYLIKNIFTDMLSQRFQEIIRENNPPFIQAWSYLAQYVQPKNFSTLYASTESSGIESAIIALLTEVKRLKDYGFTQGELDRASSRIYSQYEKSYNDRDKTESRRRTNELIDHFLDGESAPGIEWEFSRLPVILESFSLAEINDLVPVMYPDHSIVVQISMPDGKGITIPTEDQIDDLFKKVDQYAVSAYVDDASDKPLLENLPQPGKIMNQTLLNDLGVHEWELSNGVKVVAKPTGFKNDEVLFHSYAHGGNSLTSDADYRSGRLASSIVEESGAGGFNTIQLEKLLTGKLVTVSPYIDKYFHGMNGSSTPKDLETAFQLLYVMWTDPNYDQETFSNLMERYKVMVANRENNPESKWNDLVNDVNYSSHYSVQPWTPEALDDVNLDAAMKIYKERFSNPANFTFLFVGNFDLSELKKLTEVYLGGLPVLNHEKTHPVEYNYKFPYLPKHAKIYMGSEEKSRTRITFSRPLDADFDTYYYLDAATDLLEVRLRKILREDMGATYHVGSGTMNMQPSSDFAQTHIAFNCAPENVKKMTKAVMKEIKNLKKKAPTAEEVHNINEKYLNQREINLESNRYWVNALEGCYQHSIDPQDILERDDRIRSFTPEIARKMIKKYYPKFKYTTVTLYPAK